MEPKTVRKVLQIDGMTCTGCENRIENVVCRLEGVSSVKAMFSSSNVYVTYDANTITLDTIIEAIERLDYSVRNKPNPNPSVPVTLPANSSEGKEKGKKDRSKKNDDKMNINQLLGIGIIILALYVIIKNTVGFNFIPQVNQNMGYGILFFIGMLTSLHCIAMCGGINLSQCTSYQADGNEGKVMSKIKPSLLYNGGRVISYTIVGGIVGALGSAVSFSGTAKGIVAIIAGAFMVIMGLNMLNIFPWLRKINPRMPKIFGKKIYGSQGKRGPLIVGLLNGLMPCGPLQAMQIYALGTGSALAGALSMFLFSLGTVPLMFGFGAVSTLLSGKFTHKMMKVSAVLVMVLGIVMLNRGLNLSGINVVAYAATSGGSAATGSVATLQGNSQVVTSTIDSSGKYSPIIVQKGIPVKWTIKVENGGLNGCNNPVTIPKYSLQKKLQEGDNLIEFTPDEEGNITYTCWMGMVSSVIKVVPDISKVTAGDLKQAASQGGSSGSDFGAGGCCGISQAGAFAGGKIPTDQVAVATIKDGVQNVSIKVNEYGYVPAVVVVQKGIETHWNIIGENLNSCNVNISFPDFGSNGSLKKGDNDITFTPENDFGFQCGMGMLHGYVKVVDDINKINLDDIKKEVENYTPPKGVGGGGGGCCGG